jgi:hypothetical protein
MNDFRDLARQYIKNNLWVIPVNANKQPSIKNWKDLQTRPMSEIEIEKYFKKCFGIALLCGGKPKVELIDWDLKYDLSGDFYDRVKKDIPDEIKRKVFLQSTKNKGFHWIYKLEEISMSGNQKLACRYTTAYEKHQVYLEHFKNPINRDNAMKIAINDSSRVLCETRGGTIDFCGGYGLIAPTNGYEVIYKPEGGLQTLTVEEHEFLMNTIRSYNEVSEISLVKNKNYDNVDWKLSPFEDYNDRGDALNLLFECGWEEIGKTGKSVRLKRPGANSGSSGLYDLDTDIFNCFSTSTRFNTTKGYNPSGVFIELEADGDNSIAFKKLIKQGFGVK